MSDYGGRIPGAFVMPPPVLVGENRVIFAQAFSVGDYPNKGFFTTSEIHYIRVLLNAGEIVGSFETFLSAAPPGGSPETIRFGIYDQTDPQDNNGQPVNRVMQTNAYTWTAGDADKFKEIALISQYEVSVTGLYWFAMIADNNKAEYPVTPSYRANFPRRFNEAGTGSTLPATAGTLTSPVNAIPYYVGLQAI